MWPGLVLVNGRPRHPQSQGSVERSNGTIKDALAAWMRDHKTAAWTKGLFFVQWSLNTTFHEGTKVVHYQALFGRKVTVGMASKIQTDFLQNIETGIYEEMLEELCEQNKNRSE